MPYGRRQHQRARRDTSFGEGQEGSEHWAAVERRLSQGGGARPDRARIAAALDLARANLAQMVQHAPKERLPAIVEAHAELVRLTGQAPTYNFDPGLLVMQIGGLLASAAAASQPANV